MNSEVRDMRNSIVVSRRTIEALRRNFESIAEYVDPDTRDRNKWYPEIRNLEQIILRMEDKLN